MTGVGCMVESNATVPYRPPLFTDAWRRPGRGLGCPVMVAIGDERSVGIERPAKSAASPALPYDRSAAGTVSVRGFRVLVALTLVNTVLLGSMVLGPQL